MGVTIAGIVIGFVTMTLRQLDDDALRVNAVEREIAEHVQSLGGVYMSTKDSNRNITFVGLNDTSATDADVAIVLRLTHLTVIHLNNCDVTDAALPKIFSHPTLRRMRLSGTLITGKALDNAMRSSKSNVSLDEDFRPRSIDE